MIQAPAKTVWEGVYTEDQAARGKTVFNDSCATCHDLTSEFSGPAFLDMWKGQTAFNVFDTIKTEMPKDNPGGLTKQNYIDIVAFMFKSNTFPSGKSDLEPDDDTLKQIRIEPKPR
jgi:mono/diheme cytochrome c family protein